jgi:chorismate--pyruvate lyase
MKDVERIDGRRPVNARHRRWLTLRGSLTAHLHQASGKKVTVVRLSQGACTALPGELDSLGAARGWARCRTLHAREVVLHAGGPGLVYARSVSTQRCLAGPWRALRALGSRPLAELLFADPWTRRSPLRVVRIGPVGPWRRHLRHALRHAVQPPHLPRACWGRYSVFCKAGRQLRVMEVFSPAALALRAPLPAIGHAHRTHSALRVRAR